MSATTLDRPDTGEEIYHLTDEDIASFFSTVTPPLDACERKGQQCPNKAELKIWWGPDTDVNAEHQDSCRNTARICRDCFDEFSDVNHLILCHGCDLVGVIAFKRIVYSESLR